MTRKTTTVSPPHVLCVACEVLVSEEPDSANEAGAMDKFILSPLVCPPQLLVRMTPPTQQPFYACPLWGAEQAFSAPGEDVTCLPDVMALHLLEPGWSTEAPPSCLSRKPSTSRTLSGGEVMVALYTKMRKEGARYT